MIFQSYSRRVGPLGLVRHGHLQPSVVQEGEGTVDLDDHKDRRWWPPVVARDRGGFMLP